MPGDNKGDWYCAQHDYRTDMWGHWHDHYVRFHDGADPRAPNLACPYEGCDLTFYTVEVLQRHATDAHKFSAETQTIPPEVADELEAGMQNHLAFEAWCREHGRGL